MKSTLVGLAQRATIDEVVAQADARRQTSGERDLADEIVQIVQIIREARGA